METSESVDLSKSEENVPPPKRLKQAKLSFFMLSPSEPKSSSKPDAQLVGKKRKTSGGLDSPNKVAKTNKAVLGTSHSESPNSPSKVAKASKIVSKLEEADDHEVSSSSEAESNGKSSGKCCLMERFVVKLPGNVQQEISSTVGENVKTSETSEHGNENKGDKAGDDVIMIDDECSLQESQVEDESKSAPENEEESTVEARALDTSLDQAGMKADIDTKAEEEEQSSSVDKSSGKAVTETHQGSQDDEVKEVDQNESLVSNDSQQDAQTNATPNKDAETPSSKATTPKVRSASKTPKSSAKKGPKINIAKRAEQEALKQKQKEEREKQRLERKRKLEEEKIEKEKLKQQKKEAREKEKLEQKEKLEKEKQEKLKAKEDERKKKEEEKHLKEEEKRVANEVKEEEKRKKEEEKKQKEEEKKQRDEDKRLKEEEKQKEEEKKRLKEEKRKQAFQSFFKPKNSDVKQAAIKPASGSLFIPFEVKKDMHLAPAVRRESFSGTKKAALDRLLLNCQAYSQDYIQQLKSADIKPHKTGRVLRKNPQPAEDIEIIHDEEALKKVFHEVKLLQFHTDNRPPYYGTWRKKAQLNPRNPWKKDKTTFDYEVDSDEEWEEEEPGESLSCSEGEEEKAEDGEDEEDDGWMVPHGYLSEDEGCNEDDEISPEKLKLQQLAKAKAWEEEYKRKLHALPLVAVGCFFENLPSPAMAGDVRLLYEFKAQVLWPTVPVPTILTAGSVDDEQTDQASTPSTTPPKQAAKKVPEEAMPELIRLIHGNVCGIKRLIREFRVFWLRKNPTENLTETKSESLNDSTVEKESDVSVLNESVADTSMNVDSVAETSMTVNEEVDQAKEQGVDKSQKVREDGYGCSISKRQLEIKIMAIAVREKRAESQKVCWYVHDSVLSQYAMSDITLQNSWVFLTSGPKRKSPVSAPTTQGAKNEKVLEGKDEEMEVDKTPGKPKDQKSIMDFTLCKEELEKQNKAFSLLAAESTTSQAEGKTTPAGKLGTVKTPGQKGRKVTPKQKGLKNCVMDLFKKKAASTKSPSSKAETAGKSQENNMSKGELMDGVVFVKEQSTAKSFSKDATSSNNLGEKDKTEKTLDKESVSSVSTEMDISTCVSLPVPHDVEMSHDEKVDVNTMSMDVEQTASGDKKDMEHKNSSSLESNADSLSQANPKQGGNPDVIVIE